MNIDKTVKTLRTIAEHIENGGDGLCFDICGECKNAAKQLERLNNFEQSQCAILLRKIARLEAERNELKASQPLRCGECIHIFERHYEDVIEPPYIKYGCKYRGAYQVYLNDFCSYGERVVRSE